jgi:hypothetical protein
MSSKECQANANLRNCRDYQPFNIYVYIRWSAYWGKRCYLMLLCRKHKDSKSKSGGDEHFNEYALSRVDPLLQVRTFALWVYIKSLLLNIGLSYLDCNGPVVKARTRAAATMAPTICAMQ